MKQPEVIQSASDPCIYMDAGGDAFFIGVYVDVFVLAGRSDDRIQGVKNALSLKFDLKDMWKLHYFLGMSVVHDEAQNTIWIGQPAYIEKLLVKFGMQECKPVGTPTDTSVSLVQAAEGDECVDQHLYQSAIGKLMYLSVNIRPDITFAVSNLTRFSSRPTANHWRALKRVLCYLRGTANYGILYSQRSSCLSHEQLNLLHDKAEIVELCRPNINVSQREEEC